MNKNLIVYSSILLIAVPIFGINFLLHFIGNLLLLIFLIPLLLILITLISFSFLKSKIKTCDQCNSISFGTNDSCKNCGAALDNENSKNVENFRKPSETIIEVKAEEIN